MHFAELTGAEQRVLGCLIEKRWTTPDQYPLSLNALRLACNQSTNRDPVTDYSEPEVFEAAQRLSRYGLARMASGHTSRATKYRHLAEEGLGLDREQLAVLAVLVLRGPQTPGELKARSDRMAHVGSLEEVERVLGELAQLGYAERLERRAGQKEDRYRQLLGGAGAPAPAGTEAAVGVAAGARAVCDLEGAGMAVSEAEDGGAPASGAGDEGDEELDGGARRWSGQASWADSAELESRVAALESEVAALRAQIEELLERS